MTQWCVGAGATCVCVHLCLRDGLFLVRVCVRLCVQCYATDLTFYATSARLCFECVLVCIMYTNISCVDPGLCV